MENELISIIVTVYKVEKYLHRCVDSIIAQTYTNLEIILVDDGSPDDCGKMCDEYGRLDPRVRVIHKKNGGHSDALNAGLEVATGEWLGFVDADDYVDTNMYMTLYKMAKESGADIAVCNTERVYEDAEEQAGIVDSATMREMTGDGAAASGNSGQEAASGDANHQVREYTNIEALKVYFNRRDGIIGSHTWDKLYKRELFSGIAFPSGRKCAGDTATTYKVMYKAKKIVATNQYLCAYYQRGDSVTGLRYSAKNLDALISLKEQVEFFKDKSPELYKYTAIKYFNFLRRHYFKVLEFAPHCKATVLEKIREYNKLYKKDVSIIELVRHPAGWGFNIPYIAFWVSPKLGTFLQGKRFYEKKDYLPIDGN